MARVCGEATATWLRAGDDVRSSAGSHRLSGQQQVLSYAQRNPHSVGGSTNLLRSCGSTRCGRTHFALTGAGAAVDQSDWLPRLGVGCPGSGNKQVNHSFLIAQQRHILPTLEPGSPPRRLLRRSLLAGDSEQVEVMLVPDMHLFGGLAHQRAGGGNAVMGSGPSSPSW